MLDPEMIRRNYQNVVAEIETAAVKTGRQPEGVHLVVVTKTQPVAAIRAVIMAGGTYLGENYPEETIPKIAAVGGVPEVEWHMIGHLQSRKVKLVVDGFQVFEALDSIPLAEKLERALVEAGKVLPVFLEVNVSGEESKGGFAGWNEGQWPALTAAYQDLRRFPHLQIRGLMTMPPYSEDAEMTRPFFARLRSLRDYLNQQVNSYELTELSMGTSADFQVAIEEGATFVRIGQAIVGPRYYPLKN